MSNGKRIKTFFLGSGSTIAFAIISFVLALLPESLLIFLRDHKLLPFCNNLTDLTAIIVGRLMLCFLIFLAVKAIYYGYVKKRSKVVISKDGFFVQIEYGDITSIAKGKKVIHFDECYTTNIGDLPGEIKEDTVCGQYLTKKQGIEIEKIIEESGVKPLSSKSKYNSQTRYEPGTLVPNGNDLLMAFANLDKNGRAEMTYEEYLKCLNMLWEQIDKYRGTADVYIPIFGSFITNIDNKNFTQQQLLDIMIASYFLHNKKLRLPNMLHVVCKEREGFSINNVLGVTG